MPYESNTPSLRETQGGSVPDVANAWASQRWWGSDGLSDFSRDIADHLVLEMGRREREKQRVVILNIENAVLPVVMAFQGDVGASLARVAEPFRDSVRLDAAGVILVYNHSSGNPTPHPRTSTSRPRRAPPAGSTT